MSYYQEYHSIRNIIQPTYTNNKDKHMTKAQLGISPHFLHFFSDSSSNGQYQTESPVIVWIHFRVRPDDSWEWCLVVVDSEIYFV